VRISAAGQRVVIWCNFFRKDENTLTTGSTCLVIDVLTWQSSQFRAKRMLNVSEFDICFFVYRPSCTFEVTSPDIASCILRFYFSFLTPCLWDKRVKVTVRCVSAIFRLHPYFALLDCHLDAEFANEFWVVAPWKSVKQLDLLKAGSTEVVRLGKLKIQNCFSNFYGLTSEIAAFQLTAKTKATTELTTWPTYRVTSKLHWNSHYWSGGRIRDEI